MTSEQLIEDLIKAGFIEDNKEYRREDILVAMKKTDSVVTGSTNPDELFSDLRHELKVKAEEHGASLGRFFDFGNVQALLTGAKKGR